MNYAIMLIIAAILALFSSLLTAFGMVDLFKAAGTFILILFIIIDLGRFLLFNFTVTEWNNLRKIKYLIVLILFLLFGYSAIGVYSKLDSLVTQETKQAMVNAAIYNKANDNAKVKQIRSEDLARIAQEEYKNALEWNKNDHVNCMARANGNKSAENKCNNTKRSLDNKASIALKESLTKADLALDNVEEKVKITAENQNEIANVLTTICKLTQPSCDTYDSFQNALSILIFLVIVGTDYLQIAIVLAVNTRKNKKIKNDGVENPENLTKKNIKKSQSKKLSKQVKKGSKNYNKETSLSSDITPNKTIYQQNNEIFELNSEKDINQENTEKHNQESLPALEQNMLQTISEKVPTQPLKTSFQKQKTTNSRPFRFTGPKPQK